MASSGSHVDTAVVPYSTFDALRLGRTAQTVVGRLIRFWDSRNVKKNGEFMGITLLLLDELDSVIHGFIPANRADHYRSSLKAGRIVRLDRFEVARVPHTYKITEHQFVLRFIPSTRLCEVETDAPLIRPDRFMVRRFDHLQILANTNLELPDVVGEIRSVQGSDLMNTGETTRVVVRFLIDPNVTVYLSLWDEAAAMFRALLKSGDKSHAIMLVTTVNPKLFGGNLYLNSTPGTRFYFDNNLPEIIEFVSRVGSTSSQVFSCVDTVGGINKKELVTIGDLNTFISNSNEQTQEADFLCKARIVCVMPENGWSFVSCTGCHKKLERSGTTLTCNRCVNTDVTGVVRFRVELAVDDGKDSATFVVFDKEMTKLIKQEAAVLALEEGLNGEGDDLPRCFEELSGKEYVFQIRVTPFNFTPNHRTFTVSTMTEDTIIEEPGKDECENTKSFSEGDASFSPSSSGQAVFGEKADEGTGGAIPPDVSNAKNKLKRRRE